jgi:flagellar basal-body rod protein FlgB
MRKFKMKLFDSTNIPLLGKALDVYALRQKTTAANIANITTSGYKSQSVSFEEHLAAAGSSPALTRGAMADARHIPIGVPSDVRNVQAQAHDTSLDQPEGYNEMASGFNDVNIDYEMAELAKNQIRFKFGARLLGESFKGLQKAIRGTV